MSIVDKYPESLSAHAGLGFALLSYGDYEGARKEYESVVFSSPGMSNPYDLATAYFNLGIIYRERGTYKQAEQMFIKAQEMFPQTSSRIYAELGFLRLKQGLVKEALDYFKLSKEENPLNSGAYIGSGISYALLGEDKQAKEEWLQALKIDPGSQMIIKHNLEILKKKP